MHGLESAILATFAKGQLILKCLFVDFDFFQKTNKNTSQSSKNEFISSFFGRIHGLTICFWNQLTFTITIRKCLFFYVKIF